MSRHIFTTGCVLLQICLLFASAAMGRTIYVDDDAAGANDGSSWANAFVYLQDGLSSASSSLPSRWRPHSPAESNEVEIRVAQGTYKPHQATLRKAWTWSPADAAFYLRSGMSVRGGYAGVGTPDPNERDIESYRTILSGDLDGDDIEVPQPRDLSGEPTRTENSRCVVRCLDMRGTVVLDGCMVTGATYSALENHYANPTISDCLFTWNAGHLDGGAIYSQGGKLALTRCRFIANWAPQFGGAIFPDDRTVVVLTDCAFIGNQAGLGGALAGEEAEITVSGCTFEQNAADRQGAIRCSGGTLLVSDSTFRGNFTPLLRADSPGDGGAIGLLYDADATISNCLFEGNSARRGGAICSEDHGNAAILWDCLFSGNSARRGGGLFGLYGSVITNCVFAGNRAGRGGAVDSDCTGPEFANCTFVANRAENGNCVARYKCRPPGAKVVTEPIVMTNCILWDAGDEIGTTTISHAVHLLEASIAFSNVYGGWPGSGNIDVDPCLADPGHWDVNATPDDPNDDIWVNGDYHLKSQAGRWEPVAESWVLDDTTSPCIDAGDPNSPVGCEPLPNGGIINMGAYGGTAEASMSPDTGP